MLNIPSLLVLIQTLIVTQPIDKSLMKILHKSLMKIYKYEYIDDIRKFVLNKMLKF